MLAGEEDPERYVKAIRQKEISIYDRIEIGDPELWIPTPELEVILNRKLTGIQLTGLALRTRSKVVKEHVCRALGYPIPSSFTKTHPRFPGQILDTYIQKSNNVQVWNEELVPTRRYVIIRVNADDVIIKVKVVTGVTLAQLDTTGTLTQKYQARLIPQTESAELITANDTEILRPLVQDNITLSVAMSPTDNPSAGQLISIRQIFDRLSSLVKVRFEDSGYIQERNRGAELHRLICEKLGYMNYHDDGKFPDVRHQLLEVKLQTSPTIDLGLIRPDSLEPLGVPNIESRQIRHCDVRYALFYAETDGKMVTLTHFFLTTGQKFFSRFPQFQGKVLNKKLQIPLPRDFFDA
jgi:hypothetical protein